MNLLPILLEIELADLKRELQRIADTQENSGTRLISAVEKVIDDTKQEKNKVLDSVTDAKKLMVEAILALDESRTDGDVLQGNSFGDLARLVLTTAKRKKDQTVRASQSFGQKEELYLQALKRAYRKMMQIQKKDEEDTKELQGEKMIQMVDDSMRSVDDYVHSLEDANKKQEEHQKQSDEKFGELTRQMLALFEIDASTDTFTDCKAKLEQMKDGYEKEVNDLKKVISDKEVDMRALELRISVVTQRKGTVYEMLNAIQDDREALVADADKLKQTIQEYQKCIEQVADTVINDDRVQEMPTSELIVRLGEFCDNYDKLLQSVEYSELQKIFQKTLARNPMINPGDPLGYLPPIAEYADTYLTIEEKAHYVLAAIESGLDPTERDSDKVADILRQCQNMWARLKFTGDAPTVVQLVSLLMRVGLIVATK